MEKTTKTLKEYIDSNHQIFIHNLEELNRLYAKIVSIEIWRKDLKYIHKIPIANFVADMQYMHHWIMKLRLDTNSVVVVEKFNTAYGYNDLNGADDICGNRRNLMLVKFIEIFLVESIKVDEFLSGCEMFSGFNILTNNCQHFIMKILEEAKNKWKSLELFYYQLAEFRCM